MINYEDCVLLSDDEDTSQAEVQVVKKSRKRKKDNKVKKKHSTAIETIVIDDEIINKNKYNENNYVIELSDSQNSEKDQLTMKLNNIHRDDELFSDFIEKCLDLENSDGMIYVVNKDVIQAYEEIDLQYKKSDKFKRVMLKALRHLETDPDNKFTHIKVFVDTLRFHKQKRRAQLTTLATNLKENRVRKRNVKHKNRKLTSIILDSDEDQVEIPIVNLDNYTNDIIVLDDKKTDEEKENNNIISSSQENILVPLLEVPWEPSSGQESEQIIPIEYDPAESIAIQKEDKQKIEEILEQIAFCKEEITRLDEMEVVNDSMSSPYILCEKLKQRVVDLHKKFCQLNKIEPIKRRKVRLQVIAGHPPGPVNRLQAFINDNIGDDGKPLFPDFCDVIKCVMVANVEDKLGWNKQQVISEANYLFTQCGRALQKKRQRSEYRDLLAIVSNAPSEDPADRDPELLRKLEANRKLAVKKENDILERYVNLQYLPPQNLNPAPSIEGPNVNTTPGIGPNVNPATIMGSNVNPAPVIGPNVNPATIIGPNVNPAPIIGPNVNPEPIIGINVNPAPIIGPNIHPSPIIGPNVNPTPIIGPNVNPSPIIGPNVNLSPIIGPNVNPAPIIGPNVNPAPIIGPNVNQAPIIGPNVNPAPIVGPYVNPAPIIGPYVYPAPIIGPTVNPAPIIGPYVYPAPIIGPTVNPAPIIGPTVNPAPIIGPNVNPAPIIGTNVNSAPIIGLNINPAPIIEGPNENTSLNGIQDESSIHAEDGRDTPCSEVISDEDSDFEPPEVQLCPDNMIESDTEDKNGNCDSTDVKVKQERKDIFQLLEELGDNYEVSVIIDDPHLVIEISSDESSDDDIHVEGESD